MIEATADGNVLTAPTQKMVTTKDGQIKVTELRIMSDVWRREGDDLVQDPDKTSPLGISIWNERLGDQVMKLIRPGMRVQAKGALHLDRWEAKDESKKDGSEMRLNAGEVTIKLNRVENVAMRPKAEQPQESAGATS